MRILIVNDDGIEAPTLHLLSEWSSKLGEVIVVAPDGQRSAMSQRITVFGEMEAKRIRDYPVEQAEAWSLAGSPADCVKIGLYYILADRPPDVVFSGMNNGINTGYDVCYSGTVGAALEAVMHEYPAIAWSCEMNADRGTAREYFPRLARELLQKPLPDGHIYNVNFPGLPADQCRGVLYDRTVAGTSYYLDGYRKTDTGDGFVLECNGLLAAGAEEGSDLKAVQDGYVSVGIYHSAVMAGPQAARRLAREKERKEKGNGDAGI